MLTLAAWERRRRRAGPFVRLTAKGSHDDRVIALALANVIVETFKLITSANPLPAR